MVSVREKGKKVESEGERKKVESEGERKKIESEWERKNHHLLINQLHFCRFIYYLTKNINYLSVIEKTKEKVSLLLMRHLLRLVRNLADDSANWFRLSNWDSFKQSSKYTATLQTIREYRARYEKDYALILQKS